MTFKNPVIPTSSDAQAVGFSISVFGMLLGGHIGDRWGPRVKIFGGLILISIGIKILVEHLTV